MPLAIELAASWMRALPCDEVADEVARGLDMLTTHARDIEPRHHSMRAALDRSWGLMAPDEQAVLVRLSVFRGGFSRDAAATVAGASSALLSALVDKSMIRREAGGRYSMHELIRQYAREQVEPDALARDPRPSLRLFCRIPGRAAGWAVGDAPRGDRRGRSGDR